MTKLIKSAAAKFLTIAAMFTIAGLPVFANATSDNSNSLNSGAMSPAAVVGGVALIIGLVVVLAAKGSRRVSH